MYTCVYCMHRIAVKCMHSNGMHSFYFINCIAVGTELYELHILHSIEVQQCTVLNCAGVLTILHSMYCASCIVLYVVYCCRIIIDWLYEVDPDRAWDILVTQALGENIQLPVFNQNHETLEPTLIIISNH